MLFKLCQCDECLGEYVFIFLIFGLLFAIGINFILGMFKIK